MSHQSKLLPIACCAVLLTLPFIGPARSQSIASIRHWGLAGHLIGNHTDTHASQILHVRELGPWTQCLRRISVPSIPLLFAIRPIAGPPSRPGPTARGPPRFGPPAAAAFTLGGTRTAVVATGSEGSIRARLVAMGALGRPCGLVPVSPRAREARFPLAAAGPGPGRRLDGGAMRPRALVLSSECCRSA